MDERIAKIIEAGTCAPSGDNTQPWLFRVEGQRIHLFNDPGRDTSLYNHGQRASLVAHGACIENMAVAAAHFGLSADVRYFPVAGDERQVAELTLSPAPPAAVDLYPVIQERATNRKCFRGGALTAEQAAALERVAGEVSGAQLSLHRDSDRIAEAAEVAGCSDRLVFENPSLHGFLFDHLRWSAEEAQRTRDGMDILTLELAPQDKLLFPLLKNFSFVRLVGSLGATRIIAANARKLMTSASAVGTISIPDLSPASWIEAGRALERVWLEATRLGLSFHLMTGITLLVQRVREGQTEGLDAGNLRLLEKAEGHLARLAGPSCTALLFRVGFSSPPTARSLRRPPSLDGQ